ncbi:alveolin domain containing intermediate filament IMC11, partial [Cardiosporidium cionae]
MHRSDRALTTPLSKNSSLCHDLLQCCGDEPANAAATEVSSSFYEHRDHFSEQQGSFYEQRERAAEVSSKVDRKWVPVTAYQPVDTVTRTVEIPVIKTINKVVPKVVVEEKIVEVPKLTPCYVEKFIEVPEVKTVEREVLVPEVHYNTKYIPKVEVQEKIVYKPKYVEKWVDHEVEIPVIREIVRYKEVEATEEVIQYVGEDSSNIDWDIIYKTYCKTENNTYELPTSISQPNRLTATPIQTFHSSSSNHEVLTTVPNTRRIEQPNDQDIFHQSEAIYQNSRKTNHEIHNNRAPCLTPIHYLQPLPPP